MQINQNPPLFNPFVLSAFILSTLLRKLQFLALVLVATTTFGIYSPNANAAIDAYTFPNDEMRDRYHVLIDELRCPQCLNTNLAGSDAMIAKDLRREVHRLILEGQSDEEILDFMYERYGDFILYEPRVSPGTFALWFGPVLLLLIALFIGWRVANTRSTVAQLSPEEQQELDDMLAGSSSVTASASTPSQENLNNEK